VSVYDTSSNRPAPGMLNPGDGVIVYCSRTPSKVPSVNECDAYRARGVSVGFVFEDQADRAATGTYDDGFNDAQLSRGMAHNRGHLIGKPIYFACDTGLTISLRYYTGFHDGLVNEFHPGVYAGDRNLEIVRAEGAHYLWQAASSSWSNHWDSVNHHGNYPYAQLWQSVLASPVPGTDRDIVNPNNSDWNGDDMFLDPTDPQVVKLFSKLTAIDQHISSTGALIIHGDTTHVHSEDAIDAHIQSLAASMKALQAGQVDAGAVVAALLAAGLPEQLAQDLAAHLALTAK